MGMLLYDRLSARLDEMGISFYRLTTLTGIPQGHFSHWKKGKNSRLLTMATGAPLTDTSLATRLKRLEKKTGVKLSPHALRRAFITYNLGCGVPLVVVQKLAGHSDAKTTQIYDRTSADAAMDWLRKR